MVIMAALCWISPFGVIIAIVMAAVLIASHPAIAFVIGGMIALVIVFALRERWHPAVLIRLDSRNGGRASRREVAHPPWSFNSCPLER